MYYPAKFGRMPKKEICADLSKRAGVSIDSEPSTSGEKTIAWTSYFTMVYAAIMAFTPQTAAAAAHHISTIIS